eukprot:m.38388 g.38388  ORF g.38388 m.38388 type:complete len:369 (+) comp9977_c0_seq1:133-1239(+)
MASQLLARLVPYVPPRFAPTRCAPSHYIPLAMRPTPLEPWPIAACFPPAEAATLRDCEIFIKRDDMTGSTLSGNKVRKLEHLLAEAVQKGCTAVVTGGAAHSNHARATAIAARQVGLTPHLVLSAPITAPGRDSPQLSSIPSVTSQSHAPLQARVGLDNTLLSQLTAESIEYAPPTLPLRDALWARKVALEQQGVAVQLVPLGGSTARGMWGYFDCFAEIADQARSSHITDIVVACGTGGTATALALANRLAGSPFRVHAAVVYGTAALFTHHVTRMAQALGLTETAVPLLHWVEAAGPGYGLPAPSAMVLARHVARATGVMLDPAYTAKAAAALPRVARPGARLLFLHTGGVFGLGREHFLFDSEQK